MLSFSYSVKYPQLSQFSDFNGMKPLTFVLTILVVSDLGWFQQAPVVLFVRCQSVSPAMKRGTTENYVHLAEQLGPLVYDQLVRDDSKRTTELSKDEFDAFLERNFDDWQSLDRFQKLRQLKALLESLYILPMYDGGNASIRATIVAQYLCQLLKELDQRNDKQFCPWYFDRITCWPPIKINAHVDRKCPRYVHFTSSAKFVRMRCTENGTLEYSPGGPNGLANFCHFYGHCHDEDCIDLHSSGNGNPDSSNQTPEERIATETYKRTLSGWLRILRFCSLAGYLCSLLTLAVAIFIFICLRRLHCPRNVIHLHLFCAFFCRAFLTLLTFGWILETPMDVSVNGTRANLLELNNSGRLADMIDETTPPDSSTITHSVFIDDEDGTVFCKTIATLWNYILLASYSWMFVEALYLHNIIYFYVFKETNVIPYTIIGWGVPLVIIVPWIWIRSNLDNSNCWLTYGTIEHMWIVKGPIMASFLANFFLFINVIRELMNKVNSTNISEAGKYKRLAKSTVVLVVLFGIHYFVLVIPMTVVDVTEISASLLVCLFIEVIPTSLQGLFIAFVYCLTNTEVMSEVKKRYYRWRMHSNSWRIQTPQTQTSIVIQNGGPIHRKRSKSLNDTIETQEMLTKSAKIIKRESSIKKRLEPHLEFVQSMSTSGANTGCSTMSGSASSTLSRTRGSIAKAILSSRADSLEQLASCAQQLSGPPIDSDDESAIYVDRGGGVGAPSLAYKGIRILSGSPAGMSPLRKSSSSSAHCFTRKTSSSAGDRSSLSIFARGCHLNERTSSLDPEDSLDLCDPDCLDQL